MVVPIIPARIGRPPLADLDRRTERLTVRATKADVDATYRLAMRQHRSMSDVFRDGLGRVLKAEADARTPCGRAKRRGEPR